MNQLVFVYDKAEEEGIPVGIPTDDNDVRRENEPFTAYGFDFPDLKAPRSGEFRRGFAKGACLDRSRQSPLLRPKDKLTI